MALPAKYRYFLFMTMGSLSVAALSIYVFIYNYYLIQPHLTAIFWSMCSAMILRQVKKPMKDFLKWIRYNLNFKLKIFLQLVIFGNYVYSVLSFVLNWDNYQLGERFLYIVFYIILLALLLLPILLSTDTFATLIVIVGSLVLGSFVIFMIVKTCYRESVVATELVRSFIDKNREVIVQFAKSQGIGSHQHQRHYYQSYVENMYRHTSPVRPELSPFIPPTTFFPKTIVASGRNRSTAMNKDMWTSVESTCGFITTYALQYYRYFKMAQDMVYIPYSGAKTSINKNALERMVQDACASNVQYLKDNVSNFILQIVNALGNNIGWFGSTVTNFFKTSLDFLNGLSEFLFAIFIYFMFLFYFVKNDDYFRDTLNKMSPLSERESRELMDSFNGKIVKTFQYAILLACFRFGTTLFSFWYADFQVIWIFAFLSGFLSLIPVLSSWVIWVPASLFLLARDGLWSTSWLFVAFTHIALIILDTFLYNNFFKDQKPEVLGVAIILGIYSFGWSGIIKGPLAVGLTVTLLDIYLKYMNVDYNSLSQSNSFAKMPMDQAVRKNTDAAGLRAKWTRSATKSLTEAVMGLFNISPDTPETPTTNGVTQRHHPDTISNYQRNYGTPATAASNTQVNVGRVRKRPPVKQLFFDSSTPNA